MAYHRMGIASYTGLGNTFKPLMDNKWSDNKKLNDIIKEMLSEAIGLWFKEYNGVDFGIDNTDSNHCEITFGIEPSYQYDPFKIYIINIDKNKSYYSKGKAWGAYGSNRVQTIKCYRDFKRQSKFTRFVDKWSDKLTEALAA